MQEALGQLTARIDAGLEVAKLVCRGKRAGHEEIGCFLVAKTVLCLGVVDKVGDVVAAIDQVALVGHDAVVGLVVAVDVRDGREAHQHARAVGVAQAALDVVLLVKVLVDDVNLFEALVELLGNRRDSHAH